MPFSRSPLTHKSRAAIMKVRFIIGTLNTRRREITLKLRKEDIIKVELQSILWEDADRFVCLGSVISWQLLWKRK
jgi:GH24 family phage-related lysozyme (muramidase)